MVQQAITPNKGYSFLRAGNNELYETYISPLGGIMSTALRVSLAKNLRPNDQFELAGTICTVQSVVGNDTTELMEICFRTHNRGLARKLIAWYDDEYVIKYDPMSNVSLKDYNP